MATKTKKPQPHVAKKVTMIFFIIIALLYSAYTVTSYLGGSLNPFKWKWFEKAVVKESSAMIIELDNTNPEAPMRLEYAAGKTATEISTRQQETSSAIGKTISITAKINPDNASIKKVDFSAAWKNGSTEYARQNNVSDYLTIDTKEDGSTTAEITCKQAFSEDITIVCTSRDDESGQISATCIARYVKRIVKGTLIFKLSTYNSDSELDKNFTKTFESDTINKASYNDDLSVQEDDVQYGYNSSWQFNVNETSPGSISEFHDLTCRVASTTYKDQNSEQTTDLSRYINNLSLTFSLSDNLTSAAKSELSLSEINKYTPNGGELSFKQAVNTIFGDDFSTDTAKKSKLYDFLQKYYKNNEAQFEFTLSFTGISGTDYNISFPVSLDVSPLRIPVGDVELPPEISF